MSGLIVCATDFSSQAEGALAWAAALARRDGGHVDLVHVVPDVSKADRVLVFDLALTTPEELAAAGERLRAAALTAAQEFGISVRPHLLKGIPHEAILGHAHKEDARMIVLGTGMVAIERWFLGSVAERTLRSADRPIVLVPRRPEMVAWLPGGVSVGRRAPRVVAGLGDEDDGSITGFVADLRQEGPCDVTFLHLYWPMGEYARLGLHGARDMLKADPDIVQNLEPALHAKVDGLPGQGTVTLDIRPAWGEPSYNLLAAVEDRDADLLVIGAHERHGVARFLTGSVAQRLARQSRYVPVAVVPARPTTKAPPVTIPELRTVLAVTDLSPLGNAAVPHAYALVRAPGGVVELCYVHERALPNPAFAYDAPGPGLSELDRARLLKELKALVPAQGKTLGIATHVSIVDGGKAAEAIVQTAERLNVDAIAMASHGRSGLARTVLGSVAQDVLHRSRRPVYVVRSQ